jgi:hypothetical protein
LQQSERSEHAKRRSKAASVIDAYMAPKACASTKVVSEVREQGQPEDGERDSEAATLLTANKFARFAIDPRAS